MVPVIKPSSTLNVLSFFFFLRSRRPPISPQSRSSAASDVYKRQGHGNVEFLAYLEKNPHPEKLVKAMITTVVETAHKEFKDE